jgi:preprotein translocase subunit SecG
METVIIVVHLMIVLALVGVVLLQRSEGGGLGIGGGSGFMTARGAANALTRTTAILAAAFFITSLGLSLLARYGERPIDILDRLPAAQGEGSGVLDKLGGSDVPAPAAPAPAAPSGDSSGSAPADGGAPTDSGAMATQPAPAAPETGDTMAVDPGATMAPAAPAPEAPADTGVPN